MTEGFDWSELLNRAKAASFEPIPTANYHISVHEAEAVMSSTGKPMIKLKLNVEEGPHQNRKLLHQLVLSVDNETALAIFFAQLKCFGIGPEFLAQCPAGSLAPIATAMVGKHAIAKVGQKEWQGEMRNEVKGYIAIGAGNAATGAPAVGTGLPGLPGLPAVSSGAPAGITAPVSVPYGLPNLPPVPAPVSAPTSVVVPPATETVTVPESVTGTSLLTEEPKPGLTLTQNAEEPF